MEDREEVTRVVPRLNLWEAIWKIKTIPKINVFAWKLVAKAIVVRDSLSRRGILVPLTCTVCDQTETREHLTWGCEWVKQVWEELLGLQDASDVCRTVNDWLLKRCSEEGGLRANAGTSRLSHAG